MPHLIEETCTRDIGDSSDEENWDEELDDADSPATVCLFCEQEFKSIQPLALDHLRTAHSLDLLAMKGQLNMDQYSFIKV